MSNSADEFKSFAAIEALYPLDITLDEDLGYVTLGHWKKEMNPSVKITEKDLLAMAEKADLEFTEEMFKEMVTGGKTQILKDEIEKGKRLTSQKEQSKREFAEGLKNVQATNPDLAKKGKELFKMMFPETGNKQSAPATRSSLEIPVREDLRAMYEHL